MKLKRGAWSGRKEEVTTNSANVELALAVYKSREGVASLGNLIVACTLALRPSCYDIISGKFQAGNYSFPANRRRRRRKVECLFEKLSIRRHRERDAVEQGGPRSLKKKRER